MNWLDKVADFCDIKKHLPEGYISFAVTYSTLAVIVALALFVAWENGAFEPGGLSENYYVKCPDTAFMPCKNPLYDSSCALGTLCGTELVYPGTYIGRMPTASYQYFGLGTVAILLVGFLANHVVYTWRKGLE